MPSESQLPQVYLARHGETEWSLSGQHTGTTDIPLTSNGEEQARALGERLKGIHFDQVWSSPRVRAIRTAELAGLGDRVEVVPDLAEWNYGAYERLTSDEIHRQNPGWLIYRDGCPGGESVQEMTERIDRLIARLRTLPGTTILFSHGHCTRVIGVRWVELPILDGRRFKVSTAALGILGYGDTRDNPEIALWNDHRHAAD